ncbi:MAG: hypothetical protein BWK80_28475 [Desulfobacteraceae bacterium IS3]|nr:MAG: hypothetical protein BWK80_28475 [Desulfobacteraceae bacterium IS3]
MSSDFLRYFSDLSHLLHKICMTAEFRKSFYLCFYAPSRQHFAIFIFSLDIFYLMWQKTGCYQG